MKLINCLVSWQAVTDAQMLRRDKMAIDEEVRQSTNSSFLVLILAGRVPVLVQTANC